VNPVAALVFGDIPNPIGRDFDEVIHIFGNETMRTRSHAGSGTRWRPASRTSRPSAPSTVSIATPPSITSGDWTDNAAGCRFGVVCHFRDIGAQVQARQTQQLLVEELNHRVKNTLASVQAIVQHTLRSAKDPAHFASSFSGRIQSMARAHSLLTSTVWKGADLRDVIRDQLRLGPVDGHVSPHGARPFTCSRSWCSMSP
jgi:two-component sensor histidine kinase